ncbi:ribosome hibernation-promoting factor, HPF/YfiA family [Laceyella putida]|uniref:Ribosome hibernation promoting factor n=1 Tax=Laceyella putida TaxID=110101 RepID=A0ABW2RGH9_9BACL
MRYVIRGHNIEVTDALHEFVERKLGRLERYFDDVNETEAHVALTVVKDQHRVEVTIPFPGVIVRAEESSEDMYASVDLVVEKLERQIRKHKTRIHRKVRLDVSFRNGHRGQSWEQEAAPTVIADEEELDLVRTKRFHFKPMDTEEAMLQMDMLGHNFFVFTNAVSNQVNVIYKRKDGKYGLIEPE